MKRRAGFLTRENAMYEILSQRLLLDGTGSIKRNGVFVTSEMNLWTFLMSGIRKAQITRRLQCLGIRNAKIQHVSEVHY